MQELRFCGNQAEKDGLRYFWVDTCCIDKSSSAELSTAITSMFRWYGGAENAMCISETCRQGMTKAPIRPRHLGKQLSAAIDGLGGTGRFKSFSRLGW
jgi:hypothetical protein